MTKEQQINELNKVAQALKTVKVDGDGWGVMYVAVQSILKVAGAIKEDLDAINNDIKP